MSFDMEYFGEWLQSFSTGITGGLISGFLVLSFYALPTNPSIAVFIIGFALLVMIVLVLNVIIQGFREKRRATGRSYL